MNNDTNPVPLDLARAVRSASLTASSRTADEDMRIALAAHLPDFAAVPAVRELVLAERRETDVPSCPRLRLEMKFCRCRACLRAHLSRKQ